MDLFQFKVGDNRMVVLVVVDNLTSEMFAQVVGILREELTALGVTPTGARKLWSAMQRIFFGR